MGHLSKKDIQSRNSLIRASKAVGAEEIKEKIREDMKNIKLEADKIMASFERIKNSANNILAAVGDSGENNIIDSESGSRPQIIYEQPREQDPETAYVNAFINIPDSFGMGVNFQRN